MAGLVVVDNPGSWYLATAVTHTAVSSTQTGASKRDHYFPWLRKNLGASRYEADVNPNVSHRHTLLRGSVRGDSCAALLPQSLPLLGWK